jgi:hypothetical protein
MRPSRRHASARIALATLIAAFSVGLHAVPAHGQVPPILPTPIGNPCDLPGAGFVCDAAGDAIGGVASAAGDFVMRGVTVWVTNAAVWVTGKVGELIDATASPDVEAEWFRGQYRSMLAVAGLVALPLLLLAVIQALMRQDPWILVRSAFGYLPMAFVLAGAAIVGTDLLVSITDDLSAMVAEGLGGRSDSLLGSVGDAYSSAIEDDSEGAIPLFGVFLGAIILAIGAFVLWLEMVIRDAAIYIALFFLPLTFVAMIWPATSRYARRLVELLIAVILAKFVIVAIIGLASAAITNAGATAGDEGQVFERMIAGAALLVLAAWSPFALLRLIPMMELAAASVLAQRSSVSGATQSAGISTPAAYMRQAMDRHSRASASPAYEGASGTAYVRTDRGDSSASSSRHETRSGLESTVDREKVRSSRSGETSAGRGGATYAPSAPVHEGRPPRDQRADRRPETPPSEPRRPPPGPPHDQRPPRDPD